MLVYDQEERRIFSILIDLPDGEPIAESVENARHGHRRPAGARRKGQEVYDLAADDPTQTAKRRNRKHLRAGWHELAPSGRAARSSGVRGGGSIGRNRARTFSTRRDARDFDAEVRRQRRAEISRRLTPAPTLLGRTVTRTWAASHAATLAAKTRLHYASLYDHHLRPYLGSIALREITPEVIGRWQADRLASGAGPLRCAMRWICSAQSLEHAFVGGQLSANPARRVKKARSPRREEVQPLAPERSRQCAERSTPATRRSSPCSPMPVFVLVKRSVFGGETSATRPCS